MRHRGKGHKGQTLKTKLRTGCKAIHLRIEHESAGVVVLDLQIPVAADRGHVTREAKASARIDLCGDVGSRAR